MKRLLALILALAMTFSVVMPSVAADAETSGVSSAVSEDGSLSVLEAQESSSAADKSSEKAEKKASEEEASEEKASAEKSSEKENSSKTTESSAKDEEHSSEKEETPPEKGASEGEKQGKEKNAPVESVQSKLEESSVREEDSEQEASAQETLAEALESKPEEFKTVKGSLKGVDGTKYTVTLVYGENAEIPDGAKLSLVELNTELTEEEKKLKENKDRPYDTEKFLSEKALEQESFDLHQGLKVRESDYVLFTKFLDISLEKSGKDIQPQAPVTVTIETNALEEGASDALEAAFYDSEATKEWKVERKKLVEEQKEKIKSGKLKEEDARRFPEKVFRSAKITNETQKKKGTKISFETEFVSRLGISGVVKKLKSWKVKDDTVSVYGPRGIKAKVSTESMKAPEAGVEKVRAFSVKTDEKKEDTPDYDVTYWVGAGVPEAEGEEAEPQAAEAAEDSDTGVVISQLKNGKAKKELLGTQGADAPVAIQEGDAIGVAYDTGLREKTLESENVTLEGMLPKNADVTANDMLWRYSCPEDVKEDVNKGEAETLAAYDITIVNKNEEFQPENGESVSVSISAQGIDKDKKVEVWHVRDDGTVEVISDVKVKGDTVSFDATGFSVYMVVQYTVDFHYGDGDYDFSITGGNTIALSELLTTLHIANQEQIAQLLSEVQTVEFSNPKVAAVAKVDKNTTVGDFVDGLGLVNQFSEEMTAEDINAALEKPLSAGDWAFVSTKPFTTQEKLIIMLNNGETVEIGVTDALVTRNTTLKNPTVSIKTAGESSNYPSNLNFTLRRDGTAIVAGKNKNTADIHYYVPDTITYDDYTYQVTDVDILSAQDISGRYLVFDDDLVIHMLGAAPLSYLENIVDSMDHALQSQLTEEERAKLETFKTGVRNQDSKYKLFKNAEYNESTNSILITLKYFQEMKPDVPLDFIFVYDDSGTMNSNAPNEIRGYTMPDGSTKNVTFSASQSVWCRIVLQTVLQVIMDWGEGERQSAKEKGYNIRIAPIGFASKAEPGVFCDTYEDAKEQISHIYSSTAGTEHRYAIQEMKKLAQDSLNTTYTYKNGTTEKRHPIVVYLSDFHSNANTTHCKNAMREFRTLRDGTEQVPVYTVHMFENNYRYDRNIASSNDKMYLLKEGVPVGNMLEIFDTITKDAIGYFVSRDLSVRDGISPGLASIADSYSVGGDGQAAKSGNTYAWTFTDSSNQRMQAGKLYTKTIEVKLKDDAVFSPAMTANNSAEVVKNTEDEDGNVTGSQKLNEITDQPKPKSDLKIVVGLLDENGNQTSYVITGAEFELYEGGSKLWQGSSLSSTTEEGNAGELVIKPSDVAFTPGLTYTLKQTSTDKRVAVMPETPEWTLEVEPNGIITKSGGNPALSASGGKFHVWNKAKANTLTPLVPVVVKKVWQGYTPFSADKVPFTVLGNDGKGGTIAVPAYNGKDRTAEGFAEVTELTQSDQQSDGTWQKTVYVPAFVGDESSGTRFTFFNTSTKKYDKGYTIKEGELTTNAGDGKWEKSVDTNGKTAASNYTYYTYSGTNEWISVSGTRTAYINIRTPWGGISALNGITSLHLDLIIAEAGKSKQAQLDTSFASIDMTGSIDNYTIAGILIPSTWTATAVTSITFNHNNNLKYTQSSFERLELSTTSQITAWGRERTAASQSISVFDKAETTAYTISGLQSPILSLTNAFTKYYPLTVGTTWQDGSVDAASTTEDIASVTYTIKKDGAVYDTVTVDGPFTLNTAASETIKVPAGTYTVEQTAYTLANGAVISAQGNERKLNAYDITNSGDNSDKGTYTFTMGEGSGEVQSQTVSFTNTRKKFNVAVKTTWDPDDTLYERNFINYALTYTEYNNSTGKTDKHAIDGALYKETPWTEGTHNDIPAYGVDGTQTECDVTSDNLDALTENYATAVQRTTDDAGNVTFTIANTMKGAYISIFKHWHNEAATGETDTLPDYITQPDALKVQVKSGDNKVNKEIVLDEANGWAAHVLVPLNKAYTVTETAVGYENNGTVTYKALGSELKHGDLQWCEVSYDYTARTATPAEDTDTTLAENGQSISKLGDKGAEVTIKNTYPQYIARVSNNAGAENESWTYHRWLIDANKIDNVEKGAFNYANTKTGNVIIETLLKEHDRYTLTDGFRFDYSGISGLTLRTTQDETYNADGFRTTLTKGHTASMITSSFGGAFITEDIILDGGSLNGIQGISNGGILNATSGTVSILGGSTMQNCYGSGGYSGAAIYAANAVTMTNSNAAKTIEFKNCTFKAEDLSSSNYRHGGAIHAKTFTLTENNGEILFDTCVASNGGAIRTDSSNGHIVLNNENKLTFIHCDARYGGALQTNSSANITIKNSGTLTFEDCTTLRDGGGGAICAYKGEVTITNNAGGALTFKDCTSSNSGGAIYASSAVSITGAGSASFTGCEAKGSGGGLYAADTVAMSGNAAFTDCKSNGSGGGLYAYGVANITVGSGKTLAFSGCTAVAGGGICGNKTISLTNSGTVRFSSCTASGNSDHEGGGAIYSADKFTLNNSGTFEASGCEATRSRGGGIHIQCNGVVMDENSGTITFDGCKSYYFGGGIAVNNNGSNNTFSMKNNSGTVSFTSCESGYGGGICAYGALDCSDNTGSVSFDACKSTGSSNGGGGVYVYSHSATFTGTGSISLNDCSTKANGGAMYLGSDSTLTNVSTNGHTTGNTTSLAAGTANAVKGSAIYSKGNLIIKQSGTGTAQITGCAASGSNGGAINLDSGKSVSFEGNVVVEGNTNTADTIYEHNVVLDTDSNTVIQTTDDGLGSNAHIGVYVVAAQFTNHGEYEKDFGTYQGSDNSKKNLNCFTNDVNGFYGEVCPDHKNSRLIRWQSYLCKLTVDQRDATSHKVTANNGKLLYERTLIEGNYKYKPAVYNSLKDGFNKTKVKLYYWDGTDWAAYEYLTENAVNVEMLKNYEQPDSDRPEISADRSLTFKTANKNAVDNTSCSTGDVYVYTMGSAPGMEEGRATITRKETGGSMFTFKGRNNSKGDYVVMDLIFDGGSESGLYGVVDHGGIMYVESCKSFLLQNAVLRNSTTTKKTATGENNGAGLFTGSNIGSTQVNEVEFNNCVNTGEGKGHSGGGAYFESLAVANCVTVTNCHADGDKGGGLYFFAENSSVGVTYSYLNDNGETVMINKSSSFENCSSKRGGGLHFYETGCSVVGTETNKVTFKDCSVKKPEAGFRNDEGFGGGLAFRADAGSIEWVTFENCSSEMNGGAIGYYAKGGTVSHVTISNNCRATNNGGGIWLNGSELTLDACSITGATAAKGGGVYANGALTLKNGTSITGNTLTGTTGTTATNAAGIYITDGKTLTIGGGSSEETATVYGNKTSDDKDSNVRLSETSGKNSSAALSVAGNLAEGCKIRVTNAKYIYTQFGAAADSCKDQARLQVQTTSSPPTINEAKNIASDDEKLLARIDPRASENPDGTKIYWWGQPVCKITDANDTLLLKTNGEPAVYATLSLAFADITKAAAVLDGTPAKVKMLVAEYVLESVIGEEKNTPIPQANFILTSASKDDTDGFPGVFDVSDPSTRSVITRGNTDYRHTMFRMEKNNTQLTISNLVIDGNNYNPDYLYGNGMGKDGWIFRVQNSAILILDDGAELKNSYGNEGGAVFGQSGAGITMKGTAAIHDCHAVNGGAVFVKGKDNKNTSFNMEGNAKIYNCVASGLGGGVCVGTDKKPMTMTMKGNTKIYGCTAQTGAGIYVSEVKGLLSIEGNPTFGDGTAADKQANTVSMSGYSSKKNGDEEVYKFKEFDEEEKWTGTYIDDRARQDIFIAGFDKADATSLQVTGNITSGDGTIWVWAENVRHYEVDMQFAQFAENGISLSAENKESSMKAFRNARADGDGEGGTKNPLSSEEVKYLFGVSGTGNFINWGAKVDGSGKVILKKVGYNNMSLQGAKFVLYKEGSSTAFVVKHEDTDDETLDEDTLESSASGIIWIGELPYGTYYLKETTTPRKINGEPTNAYDSNQNKWFCLIMDETGVWMSKKGYKDTESYGNTQKKGKEAAKADADAVKEAALS